jgi:glycosyltransferase involved in cell wall biosynthesis
MLSIKEIHNIITSGKKIVWTMHDMWPFTGICHYADACENYQDTCRFCPYLVLPTQNDISHIIFQRKLKIYAKCNISFVACSNWLKQLAEKSPIMYGHKVTSIPNPIDTDIYLPKDKNKIRDRIKLPKDKKIVLFVAMKVSDPRKGIDYLIAASHIIA